MIDKKIVVLVLAISALSAPLYGQVHDKSYYALKALHEKFLGKYNEAYEDLNTAIKIDPNDTQLYNERGVIQEKRGNYAQAMADFQKALALSPDNAAAIHNIAALTQKTSGNNSAFTAQSTPEFEYGPVKQATPNFNAPNERTSIYNRDNSYLSYAPFSGTQTKHSDNSSQPKNLSQVQPQPQTQVQSQTQPQFQSQTQPLSQQQYKYQTQYSSKSNETLETTFTPIAIKQVFTPQTSTVLSYKIINGYRQTINPTSFNVAASYNGLGVELCVFANYDEAIKQFNEAIAKYENYAIAFNNRGVAYALLGDNKKALEDFNQALRLNPYYFDAQYNREQSKSRTPVVSYVRN